MLLSLYLWSLVDVSVKCVFVKHIFVVFLFVIVCVFVRLWSFVYDRGSSARPWMDSLDPETLYVSPEQTGQTTLPLPNLEVSGVALVG